MNRIQLTPYDQFELPNDIRTGCGCITLILILIVLYSPFYIYGIYQESQENKFASSIVEELENEDRYFRLKRDWEECKTKELEYKSTYVFARERANKLRNYIDDKKRAYNNACRNAFNNGNALGVGLFAYAEKNDTELNQAIRDYNFTISYIDEYKLEYEKFKREHTDKRKEQLCKYIKDVIDERNTHEEYDSEKIFTHVVNQLYLKYKFEE